VLFQTFVSSTIEIASLVKIVVGQVSKRKERSGCTPTKQYEIFLNRKSIEVMSFGKSYCSGF
jgi:hypothetical protein